MNSEQAFLNQENENVEAIVVQSDEPSTETGVSTIGASVAGAAVGAVIGGKVAGTKGAVIGAVAGAVAGGLTAQAVPDDAGEKLKEAAENTANKVQDTVEQIKPSIESLADKAKRVAVRTADNIQDTTERAKPGIQSAIEQTENTALNAADTVQDRAEQAKPSHHQETPSIEMSEPFVMEPSALIPDEVAVIASMETFPGTQDTIVEVYEISKVSEEPADIENSDSFKRESEQHF
ncbi:MAG TPA: hypothetical protein DCL61_14920 [Cyanobacteria bacterium UBA12227]|nr:hypothetical protein [Cyanobacteria bacterium UBA12227]HAX89745.1 hypothetical protein [Cyanobacteria bacterium UBA11370]HBY81410.1 hypothetical protein [Cyanobacteria bacterium UBA11148]